MLLYYVCNECDQQILAARPEASDWRRRHCRVCSRVHAFCNHRARNLCPAPDAREHWIEYVQAAGVAS